MGRYTQSDPIGILFDNDSPERQVSFEMGVDLPEAYLGYINHNYGYADQNPVMYIDSTGENTAALGAGYGFSVGGPVGAVVGGLIGAGVGVGIYLACSNEEKGNKEHTKGKRQSTKGKHEKGRSRNKKDRGGEKGAKRRPY